MAAPVARMRSDLRDLLSGCRAVEARRTPPFDLDVGAAMATLAAYFPALRELEDLRLDAAVLNGLSRVVQIQEARLRYEAGLFLADPRFLAEKLASVPAEALAASLLAGWHPVAQLEQVTVPGLEAAIRYFDTLPPWRDRRSREPEGRPPEPRRLSEEDLAALGVARREGFLGFLGDLSEELRRAGPTEYWAFVDRGDRVERAYGTSFLVSYGYAELEERDGRLEVRANPERVARKGCRSSVVVVGGGT